MSPGLAAGDLAAGFAAHTAGWARNRGAPADVVDVVKVAAACVSEATAQGSVCIPLSALASLFEGKATAELRSSLLSSQVVGAADSPEVMPLVLDSENRLYLRRYFDYERRLAADLL